ncbi:valine--tRNA ligase [Candidatus Woesearchaeota archaeon]|nr:valine--tRNA ligase [Candidatus Woesearchaeota archaeon]
MELPPSYEIKEREAYWQKEWEKNGTYNFDREDLKKEIYAIDTPPPTVSGKMHIGHVASYTQQDIVARYQRMQQKNVFYPFGTDDNGLATEKLVERINKVRSKEMSRTEFVNLCLKTLKEIRPEFIKGWKDIAMSCDWSLTYSTIEENVQKISQQSFIDLYYQNREYRAIAPTIWCPECRTAIAQVDLEDKEQETTFNEIEFEVGKDKLKIATTRPELLPACVALFYHPTDHRYIIYKGKMATVPIFRYKIPILEDNRVEKEKGTGLVMCCTFGDQTDIEWYKAYRLPLKKAITEEGKLTKEAGKYAGKKVKEARKEIIEDLRKQKLLTKQEPIKHTVNVHERCKTEIEILESKQWFIKYLDLKDRLLENGMELNWYPAHMRNRLDNWIKGLQWDWCISRQRHFGIPFPVWYCKNCGEIIIAEKNETPVDPTERNPKRPCPKCKRKEFEPEKDVMDTWPTSALTPQIAQSLLKEKKIHKRLFPMNLRPQAHDIISFWLFNTMVKSQLHHNKNPWQDVIISGWVLDPKGRKMSKSLGNVIEPRGYLDKYGADITRFWAASVKLGEDMPFQEKEFVAGKKTITKLWNATKLIMNNLEGFEGKEPKKLEILDRWILSKLQKLVRECTGYFERYEYSKVRQEVDNFFWNIFCDYYLEIVKDRLYNNGRKKEAKKSAQYTLYTAILTQIKLFAPILPHITEEIYQHCRWKEGKSIHKAQWPRYLEGKIDEDAEKKGEVARKIISKVRKFKAEQGVSMKQKVIVTLKEENYNMLKDCLEDIKSVVQAQEIRKGNEKVVKAT